MLNNFGDTTAGLRYYRGTGRERLQQNQWMTFDRRGRGVAEDIKLWENVRNRSARHVSGKRKSVPDSGAQGAVLEMWQQFTMASDYESCVWNLERRKLPRPFHLDLVVPQCAQAPYYQPVS